MKKLIILLSLLYCSHVWAFNEADYNKLLNGEKNLTGADLKGAVIESVDLSDVNFTKADLSDSIWKNIIVTNGMFDATNFDNAHFEDVVFKNSTIVNGTTFNKTKFIVINSKQQDNQKEKPKEEPTFSNVTFDETTIKNTSFDHAIFICSDFLNSHIEHTKMTSIHAEKLYFTGCDLAYISFEDATLNNLLVRNAVSIGAWLNFSGSELTHCCFLGKGKPEQSIPRKLMFFMADGTTKSLLEHVDLYNTTLNGCFFYNINFVGTLNVRGSANSAQSIFNEVAFQDTDDELVFKARGAKVNGDYDKQRYGNLWDNGEGDFWTGLFQTFATGVIVDSVVKLSTILMVKGIVLLLAL